jgi:DNA polymerase-3 subunit gamma/tau
MLTAILNSTEPQVNLETNQIKLIYPNAMMMEEVKKNQSPIINYLRDQLQNFDLSFDLHFNEENEKTFVYTPQEKYSKLMEINPLLAEFRKLFDLDI